jgi:hypothetical protein
MIKLKKRACLFVLLLLLFFFLVDMVMVAPTQTGATYMVKAQKEREMKRR